MRVGVIDVGTNSVRVLIADVEGEALASVERDLVITRLGEGVDRTGALGEEPLRRTVEAIAGYAERCRRAGVASLRIAATSAVRDAANRDEFTAAVRSAAGVEPVVLSGDDEARLAFAGAARELPGDASIVVLDIGGGSTELVLGRGRAERWISLDIGAVRLTERHVHGDPPSAADLDAVAADVAGHLERAEERLGRPQGARLVGLAGTITTLAAVALQLERYDRDQIHHSRLGRADVAAIVERLAGMTAAERRMLPAMPRGREDVIVAGGMVLRAVMDRFGMEECLVSESDILDGLATMSHL